MPLYLTASHSSALKRSATTISGTDRRSKPAAKRRRREGHDGEDDGPEERLDDTGKTLPLATNSKLKTVPEAVDYALSHMFADIPDRAGMNSTRIAEILNFRKGLPPIVSLAHVHSLITASTRTEREIAQMAQTGSLRKITVAGRGNDISGLAEFVIRSKDYEALIDDANLEGECRGKFKGLLRSNPRAVNISASTLQPQELTALVKSGFLVSASAYEKIKHGSSSSSTQFSPSRQAIDTPTGYLIPTKDSSFENLRASAASQPCNMINQHALTLSVPNIGPYLRLLSASRDHLIALLGKSKYGEVPASLLKERWDGAVENPESRVSSAKRTRGEFAGIPPARTKRWKHLFGLEFHWVLDECLGAGLVEQFETHTVGIGIRAL